jgi:hypothetical protein
MVAVPFCCNQTAKNPLLQSENKPTKPDRPKRKNNPLKTKIAAKQQAKKRGAKNKSGKATPIKKTACRASAKRKRAQKQTAKGGQKKRLKKVA